MKYQVTFSTDASFVREHKSESLFYHVFSFPKCESVILFQSRNRGSFGFKTYETIDAWEQMEMFQSRNRGSFGFKYNRSLLMETDNECFNLVIEVLLVSRLIAGAFP